MAGQWRRGQRAFVARSDSMTGNRVQRRCARPYTPALLPRSTWPWQPPTHTAANSRLVTHLTPGSVPPHRRHGCAPVARHERRPPGYQPALQRRALTAQLAARCRGRHGQHGRHGRNERNGRHGWNGGHGRRRRRHDAGCGRQRGGGDAAESHERGESALTRVLQSVACGIVLVTGGIPVGWLPVDCRQGRRLRLGAAWGATRRLVPVRAESLNPRANQGRRTLPIYTQINRLKRELGE